MKIKNKKYFFITFIFFLLFYININTITLANAKTSLIKGDPENGLKLFKKECTACHSIDLNKKLIGPPLEGITKKRNIKWLNLWIKDSQSLIKSGDKDAINIYNAYNKQSMNSFLHLSQQDISDILSFIESPNPNKKQNNTLKNVESVKNDKILNITHNKLITLFIIGFSVIIIILLIIFIRLYHLIIIIKSSSIQEYQNNNNYKIPNLIIFLQKNKLYAYIILFIFILISIFNIWQYLMLLDVNKGYNPIQPIYFSHKIHTGINKIDCMYCHSSAKYSKISGIPTGNVCMNCHITIEQYKGDYIEYGKNREFYNQEIKKIYKAVGWNSITRKYENKIYPIKWVRIHNMPDFVNFNHLQHIIIGKESIKKIKNVDIVCMACHGNVDKMDSVKMINDFTMEWCISCHRQAKIDINNKYYIEYFNKTHNLKLKKLTVENIGGIECGKCHY